MASKDEEIKKLQDKKTNILKKINANKKSIPGDQAQSQAQDPSDPEGRYRKLQFLNKRNAEVAANKQLTLDMAAIDKEISDLKSSTEKENTDKENEVEQNKEKEVTENKMAKLTKTDIFRLVEANEPARIDRKSTRLNSSHIPLSRMPSSA